MIRYNIPAVSITGQHGRIWTTKPAAGQGGLVAVLQVPASKFSEAVRSPDFTVAAMERRADLLVTADTRGHVYVFDIRQNRFACLDKAGCAGTAALVQGPRTVFVAFADSSIRCYDAAKGTVVGVLREHRSPVRHMEVNRELDELMSTSLDGVLVWDIKKLRRKRVLGSGPYGALQASYTPDGLAVVTHFKDGSFYIWSVGNFALLRSFTLPVAPTLRPLQSSFCLSADGQLLVACGPSLPVLLVYSVIGGVLRYGVGLPGTPSALDVGAAAVDAAAAAGGGEGEDAAAKAAVTAAATAAAVAEAAAGVVPLVPAGVDTRTMAAATLAAKLPMAVGVQQVTFLPDSATVAAMLTDGSVAFVDVLTCCLVGAVPYTFPNRPDGSFSMDARAQHMALTADGKVFLYDLAARVGSVQPPRPLPRVLPAQLDDLAAAVALEHLRRQRAREQEPDGQAGAGSPHQDRLGAQAESGAAAFSDTQQLADNATTGAAGAAVARKVAVAGGMAGRTAGQQQVMAMPPAAAAETAKANRGAAGAAAARQQLAGGDTDSGPRGPAAAARGGVGAARKPDPAAVSLNRTRLEALLEAFGEYPAKYRLMIWDFLLQLPHNTAAFASLAGLGLHSAFKDIQARLPLANRALAQRLAATLSQLAHWCPVFAESSFLPDLVFPFVKLFASAPGVHGPSGGGSRSSAALDERCFETLATLLACGWMRGWFERFPHPPVGLLSRVQDLLALHDAPLAAHLSTFRGGLAGVVWPHLATLWTELLTRSDWLRLWDHCITAGPDLLYHFVAAYFINLRAQVMAMDTDRTLANWLAGPPPVDTGEVLKLAYLLRNRTPEELRPVPSEWQPLPKGPTYTEFKGFPAGAVELFAADRARIRDAEDAIMRRRAVVSELELRTRAVALQAASLSTERQQLAALEEERRAMLRQLEADAATEMARLDDKAKEEKLKQITAVEKAYQDNLLEVRATWQRELEFARAELAHKRAMAAQQIRSRQEDEQIKALEFHAQQRMREMEDDVRRAAVASTVRDELLVQQMEAEAKQRAKLKEWETEDEARKQRLQHEGDRRAALAMAAEEAAARSAAAREAQSLALRIEDEVIRVDGQRRLRRLAEDAALVTAEARAAEEARLAARAAAEQEAMRLRAKADLAWYEAEQMRREQLLEQERVQMELAADAARRKLADTEAAARTMAAQVDILERRRALERQNVAEEARVRRLVGVMAAERGRDAVLVSDLEAKEDEMKAKLDGYARLGSLQREAESAEAAAAVALLAKLDEQQRRELLELRRLHDAALARLSRDLEGQATEAAALRRAELQLEHMEAMRAQHEAFERRKQELTHELLNEQERRLRKAAGAAGTAGKEPSMAAAAPAAAAAAAASEVDREAQHVGDMHTTAVIEATTATAAGGGAAGGVLGADVPSAAHPAASRPAAAGASEAGRHVDMLLRALGVGSETSTSPDTMTFTASGTATGSAPLHAESRALRALAGLFTPRRRSFDFLSDSNMTPASYISTLTTSSSAPSPESAIFRGQAPGGAATGPTRSAAAAAAAAAALAATAAGAELPAAPARAASAAPAAGVSQGSRLHEREDTQGSIAGAWPPGTAAAVRAARRQTAADRPQRPAAVPTASSSTLASGTASSDTVPSGPDDPPAGRPATFPGGTLLGGGTNSSSNSDGDGAGGGRPGRWDFGALGASNEMQARASREWPSRMPTSPLRDRRLDDELTPSTSPSSFLPTVTPSTAAATSSSLIDSSARMPREPLDRSAGASIAAASAMQRAAMAVARAVSSDPDLDPDRSAVQPHQSQLRAIPRDLSPSTTHGESSSSPSSDLRALLGLDWERGLPDGRTAGVGLGRGPAAGAAGSRGGTGAGDPMDTGGASTSSFLRSSASLGSSGPGFGSGGGVAAAGNPAAAAAASAFAAAAAAARAVSQAGSLAGTLQRATRSSGDPRARESGPAAEAVSGSPGSPRVGRPVLATSQSDSWSSMQRSGLLGLSSQPRAAAPQGAHRDLPGSASVPAGLDALSTTSGATSLTTTSAFTSHVSFTPLVRPTPAQQSSQSQQPQPGQPHSQRRLQERHSSPGPTPISAASTASSSYSSAGAPLPPTRAAAAPGGVDDGSGGSTTDLSSGSRGSQPAPAPDSPGQSDRWFEGVRGGEPPRRPLQGSASGSSAGRGLTSADYSPSTGPSAAGNSGQTESIFSGSTSFPTSSAVSLTPSDLRGILESTTGSASATASVSGVASSGLGHVSGSDSGLGSGAVSALRKSALAVGMSSSSAGFPSLRGSGSSSAVLLGGMAHGAAASGTASRVAGAGAAPAATLTASYGSDLDSSPTSDEARATAATASLRPALSTGAAAALYGSTGTSGAVPGAGGGGSWATIGGGVAAVSGSGYETRSGLTHSSMTTDTGTSTDATDFGDSYAGGGGGTGIAASWSRAAAAAAAEAGASSSGASSDDVAEVLRLLRLTAKDDLGLHLTRSPQPPPPAVPPASSKLEPPRPGHLAAQHQRVGGGNLQAATGAPSQWAPTQQPRLPPSSSEQSARTSAALPATAEAGVGASGSSWSLPVGGGGARPEGGGFGSRVGSSAGTSMAGSERGAARAGSVGTTGHGGAPAPPAGGQAGRDAGRRAGDGSEEQESDDEDDDDASMVVEIQTPMPPAGRLSPPLSHRTGADADDESPGPGGGGGGRRSGDAAAAALYGSEDGASELFGSSPGASTARLFTEGCPQTPGGNGELEAMLRRMGMSWPDTSLGPESTTPTTVTDITGLYDDDVAPLTVATRATSGNGAHDLDLSPV